MALHKLNVVLLGFAVGVVLGYLVNRRSPALAETESLPAFLTDEPAAPPKKPSRDPLTEIDGIGPAYEQALQALGIETYAQLAQQNPDDLAARLSARVSAARIRQERWIEQAQEKMQ
jgi:predicted flap endonuclease-1-like 5' DNA nuclease